MADEMTLRHSPLEFTSPKGTLPYTAFCIPPNGRNFSLANLYEENEPASYAEVAALAATELKSRHAMTAFAPSVAAQSGIVVRRQSFAERFDLGGVTLFRNRYMPADGVELSKRQAFIMSARGCALVIAHGGGHMVAAHAGLESLIDRRLIVSETRTRDHVGIVHAIAEYFTEKGVALVDVTFQMLFYIHPDEFRYRFDDPEHGKGNIRLHNYLSLMFGSKAMNEDTGAIDLSAIASGFARKLGFGNVDSAHSLRSRDGFALTGDERNLVGVVRL